MGHRRLAEIQPQLPQSVVSQLRLEFPRTLAHPLHSLDIPLARTAHGARGEVRCLGCPACRCEIHPAYGA
jgi:hypothetical protein